jgi:hypothetical protein
MPRITWHARSSSCRVRGRAIGRARTAIADRLDKLTGTQFAPAFDAPGRTLSDILSASDDAKLRMAALNTAMMTCVDDVDRLLMRFVWRQELHLFIEPRHHAWLAEIIRDGLRQAKLAVTDGWNDVVGMLTRVPSVSDIFLSYGVTNMFPSSATYRKAVEAKPIALDHPHFYDGVRRHREAYAVYRRERKAATRRLSLASFGRL